MKKQVLFLATAIVTANSFSVPPAFFRGLYIIFTGGKSYPVHYTTHTDDNGNSILKFKNQVIHKDVLANLDTRGAIFEDCVFWWPNLINQDLTNADFKRCDFRDSEDALNRTILKGAKFSGCGLGGVMLTESDLEDVSMTNEHVEYNSPPERFEFDFSIGNSNVDIDRYHYYPMNLSKAKLMKVNLSKAKLIEVNLTDAEIKETNLAGSDLSNSNLSNSNIKRSNFTNALLIGINANGSKIIGSLFIVANISGSNIRGSKIKDCSFEKASITKCDFYKSKLVNNGVIPISGYCNTLCVKLKGTEFYRIDRL